MVDLPCSGVGNFTVGDLGPGHGRLLRLVRGSADVHSLHRASFPMCYGHEFQAKFHWHVEDKGIRHAYIKPSSPQLNGKVERSHRSDEQEF